MNIIAIDTKSSNEITDVFTMLRQSGEGFWQFKTSLGEVIKERY